MNAAQPTRIVILGGGFGGLAVAQHLEKVLRTDHSIQVTLISRDNYIVFTPMLPEVAAGQIAPDHVATPLRRYLRRVRVWQGDAISVDLQRRVLSMRHMLTGAPREVPYDHLVLALGSVTSYHHVPGAEEYSLPFKALADAARARARVIDAFEQAALETDPAARRSLLTFVVAGGGNTGVELAASLNDLLETLRAYYPRLAREQPRLVLVHHGSRLMEEFDEQMGAYALRLLRQRGLDVRLNTDVKAVREDGVDLSPGGPLPARTVFWAAGIAPSPFLATLPVPKDRHGAVVVDEHFAVPGYPGLWALGDNASVPDAKGGTYAPLAQNAIREGPVVAANILATLRGEPLRRFAYQPMGVMTSLGRRRAVATVFGRHFSGLPAWALWRAAYLSKLPGLDRKARVGVDWLLDVVFPPDIIDTLGEETVPPAASAPSAGSPRVTSTPG